MGSPTSASTALTKYLEELLVLCVPNAPSGDPEALVHDIREVMTEVFSGDESELGFLLKFALTLSSKRTMYSRSC